MDVKPDLKPVALVTGASSGMADEPADDIGPSIPGSNAAGHDQQES